MKQVKIFLIILSLCVFAYGCGNKPDSPATNDSTLSSPSAEPTLKEKQDKAVFITETTEDSMGIPHTTVSVDYNDSRTVLDPMLCAAILYDAEQYAEMEIPVNAIAAIGGWYAGGGDYYYIVPTDKGIAVYSGWQDEQQEDEGYHWELSREIE